MKNAILMIEGGKPLEMVKQYIADTQRINRENAALAKELGVESIYTDRRTGALTGVVFTGEIHPEFSKPKKRSGVSYPKKGTEWAKRLDALEGTRDAAPWIAAEFDIPLSVAYTSDGRNGVFASGEGWRHIGNPLNECGFMWLSLDGPYAMWTPDVPAIVTDMAKDGDTVTGKAASFQFNIEGARLILREEWDVLVAQHNLAKKQKEAAA